MTFVAEDVDPAGLERKSPTEAADIDEITRGMLAIQAQAAAAAKRPLARGTHAKGICVRAEFEVFDVRQVSGDPAQAERLARGHLRGARHLPGHRALRKRRRRPSPRPLARRPGHVVLDRRAAGRGPGRHAPRFFDEQREHVSDQRLACVRGGRPGALRRGAAREVEGAAVADVGRIPRACCA